jgi:hypothetical protein
VSRPWGFAQTGSDTYRRYTRLAVSGWEHNRDRGESKLREMKSDPTARADASPTRPYQRGVAARCKRLAISGWEYNRDRGESKLRETKSDPISLVSVDFYYDFARQNEGLLIYLFPSEITNAEYMPSGHLIEPTAA